MRKIMIVASLGLIIYIAGSCSTIDLIGPDKISGCTIASYEFSLKY